MFLNFNNTYFYLFKNQEIYFNVKLYIKPVKVSFYLNIHFILRINSENLVITVFECKFLFI